MKDNKRQIDLDFLPYMIKLDYELVKTDGKLDGTRYRFIPRTKRYSSSNKNK